MAGIPATDTVTATTTADGSGSAATADLGETRTQVGVFYDSSGAATLNVEVLVDGSWETFSTTDLGSATTAIETFDIPFEQVRAYLDANTNKVAVQSKGVS